jgi:hypothetical protein
LPAPVPLDVVVAVAGVVVPALAAASVLAAVGVLALGAAPSAGDPLDDRGPALPPLV